MTESTHASTLRISAVIPTHGRNDFLRSALESFAAQTRQADEIVVVSDIDDPGAQATVERARAELGIPATYIYDPATTGGASASRNLGAKHATGDILAFLDDDDLLRESYLEKAVSAIASSGKAMAVTWRLMVKGSLEVEGPTIEEGLHARDVLAVSLGTTGSNMVMTRESFWKAGGFDVEIPVKNDTDFFYRYLKSGSDYAVVREYLVLQVKHGTGQLTGNNARRANGILIYKQKHKADLRLSDRRHLMLSYHRIRYHMAGNVFAKYGHLALALLNYSPAKYLSERRIREMWVTLENAPSQTIQSSGAQPDR